jgi:hypothetical protein
MGIRCGPGERERERENRLILSYPVSLKYSASVRRASWARRTEESVACSGLAACLARGPTCQPIFPATARQKKKRTICKPGGISKKEAYRSLPLFFFCFRQRISMLATSLYLQMFETSFLVRPYNFGVKKIVLRIFGRQVKFLLPDLPQLPPLVFHSLLFQWAWWYTCQAPAHDALSI